MKNLSEDNFEFTSTLGPTNLISTLTSRTLHKKFLSTTITDKDFIGQVGQNSFKIIDSAYVLPLPFGAACVLTGFITDGGKISATTTLHDGFRLLFWAWVIAITMLPIVLQTNNFDGGASIARFIGEIIMSALIFRLVFHVLYVYARNKLLKKLKGVLQVAS